MSRKFMTTHKCTVCIAPLYEEELSLLHCKICNNEFYISNGHVTMVLNNNYTKSKKE